MADPVGLLLAHLAGVRRSGKGWIARCPGHEDLHASLTVAAGSGGRALLTCHAGCTPEVVLAALGLGMTDLFPTRDLAPPPEATAYDIRDTAGVVQAVHVRYDRLGESKKVSWRNSSGGWGLAGRPSTSLPLYGAERVAGWDDTEPVYITEGEKAADAAVAVGLRAIATVTGASTIPDPEALAILDGRDVILSPDQDVPGVAHMLRIAAQLVGMARSVQWLDPAGWPENGDLADILAPGISAHRLHDMVSSDRPLQVEAAIWDDLGIRIGPVPQTVAAGTALAKTAQAVGFVRSVPRSPAADVEDRATQWPEIDPLTLDAALPAFPLEMVPAWMSDMIRAVAANTETDACMAAVTVLGLASVPLSNRFTVLTRTWSERGLNLAIASIAASGELKTAVFGRLDEPLRRHEREVLADEAPGRRDHERARKDAGMHLSVARQGLAKAVKSAVVARADFEKSPEALVKSEEAVAAARKHLNGLEAGFNDGDAEQPAPYALLADDSTPEALQRQMAQQDGRVGVVSAESELFLMAAGRYSDKGPNLQVYLSGFSGEPLRGDRITREMPQVEHPGLSIVISTQPVVLEEARRNAYLQRRGVLARFLFAVPTSRAGTRHLVDRPIVPSAVDREYSEALMRLCRLGDAQRSSAPVQLRLIGEAGRRLEVWHDDVLEPRRHREKGDLGASEAMAAWSGRLHGLVVRIVGVLHVAKHLEDAAAVTIEPGTVTAAIAIGEWAIDHAFAAFGIDRLDSVGHDALRLLRWYEGRLDAPGSFTVRAACRGLRGLDADQVRGAIRRLEDHGYVRLERSRPGTAGGRPSDTVAINPACLSA